MADQSVETTLVSVPGLHCSFRSDDPSKIEKELEDDANTLFIPQEKGKKSSYVYSASNSTSKEKCIVVHKPAHLVIEYRGPNRTTKQKNPFFLGGFQIICNSRQIEVYLSNKEGKETYLMTSRGIPVRDSASTGDLEHMHKAVSVVPGGPRAVTRLHLKLLSLRPTGEVDAKLRSIKVTARLPEPPAPKNAGKVDAKSTTKPVDTESIASLLPNNSSTKAVPGLVPNPMTPTPVAVPRSAGPFAALPDGILTQSDLGAAMAGMSAMARATEDRVVGSIKEMEMKFTAVSNDRWDRMEKHMMTLTGVVVTQKKVMEQQNQLVVRQQQMILEQSQVLKTLLDQQSFVMSTVKSLQGDVHHSHKEQRGQQGQLQELLNKQQQNVIDAMKDLERAVSPIQHVLELTSTLSDDSQKDESSRIGDIFLRAQQQQHEQQVSNILREDDSDADMEELEIGAAVVLIEDKKLGPLADTTVPLVGNKLSPIAEVGTASWDTTESSVHTSDTAEDKQDSAQGEEAAATQHVIVDHENKTIVPIPKQSTSFDDEKKIDTPSSGDDEHDLEQPGHIPMQSSKSSNTETDDLTSEDPILGDIPMIVNKSRSMDVPSTSFETSESKETPRTPYLPTESEPEEEEKKEDTAKLVFLPADVDAASPSEKETLRSSPRSRNRTPKMGDGAFDIETVPSDECTPRATSQLANTATDVADKKSSACCFVFGEVEDAIGEIGLGVKAMDDISKLEVQNKQVLGGHVAEPMAPVADGDLLGI